MKLAVITPTQNIESVILPLGMGYHYVDGYQLHTSPPYVALYERLANRGGFLMVDVCPNVHNESTTSKIAAAKRVGADEIILPYVMGDRKATLDLARLYIDTIPSNKTAIMPQGDSIQDWLQSLHELRRRYVCTTICIPAYLEEFHGGRVSVLEEMIREGIHKTYHIHLHEIYRHSYHEVAEAFNACPDIRGISTSTPIAAAQQGETLTDRAHYKLDWVSLRCDVGIAQANIKSYALHCAGAPEAATPLSVMLGGQVW